MPLDLSGRQIFLASPAGLGSERERLRQTADQYNRRSGFRRGVAFVTRGWEEVPGGLGRPQSLINAIVDECDYAVVVLADRWGSPPGGEEEYSSGTEEEFFHALNLRGDDQGHMRDVLVLFRSVPDAQLADPGPELRKVLRFRQRLQDSKKVLYDTFDSLQALEERFEKALAKWAEPWNERAPLQIVLPPAADEEAEDSLNDPLARALQLAAAGQLVQAEMVFARAVQNDDLRAMSEFARFLRRQGRLNDSRELNLRVVGDLVNRVPLSPEDAGILSDSLANIGVIARKQGKLAESARTLREAVKVATDAAAPLPRQLAYALDNLGHTQSQLGSTDAAAASFAEAESIRADSGDEAGKLASLLNQGWSAIRARDYEDAVVLFGKAEVIAKSQSDDEGLARALAGKGSGLQKSGQPEPAIESLLAALEINTRLNASDGVGIVSGLLARSYLMMADPDAAMRAATETLESSQTSTNVVGLATGKWVLAQVERYRAHTSEAAALYEEAITLARQGGSPRLAAAIEADYAGPA